jgi:ankyrin repeat protein
MSSFIDACQNSNLHKVKELFAKDDNAIEDCSTAFHVACYNCHLHIAKWLLSVEPSIDVRKYDDIAFRGACYNGHHAVAKWLLSIEPSIDVRANDDEAFCWACYKGHLHVAKWLQRLIPTLKNVKQEVFNDKRTLQLISFFLQ